ncbi:hypothetical protein [Leptospira borgpetersenii]|uniref:hypothetical protein n=1 Tax=Leptospira borgpetersenii TaxID=174 RepID=UPI0007735709|nr:hypothetical protein [Leptospira borgpetersenii]
MDAYWNSEYECFTPIACTLSTEELRSRKENYLRLINDHKTKTDDLENGYSFAFEDIEEYADKILKIILMERKCCSFLNFSLRFTDRNGPAHLDIFGPPGTKEFIRTEMGL